MNQINFNSIEWAKIKQFVTEELEALRSALERKDMDHDKTQYFRGRITQCRRLLKLEQTGEVDSDN